MSKFLAFMLFISVSVFAQDSQPKHLFSVTTDGFGWSGSARLFDHDKEKSGVKDHEKTSGELKLNYSYIFGNKIMLGGEISNSMETSEIKDTTGDKIEEEEQVFSLAITLGYNFNDDLINSWWVKAGLGAGRQETVVKDSTASPSKMEAEYSISSFYIEAGKRFAIGDSKNISYAPSLLVGSHTYGEDADDAGLDSATEVRINLIKFDILL